MKSSSSRWNYAGGRFQQGQKHWLAVLSTAWFIPAQFVASGQSAAFLHHQSAHECLYFANQNISVVQAIHIVGILELANITSSLANSV